MEIKDVAGVRLAARRTAQQKRNLAVRFGLLGKVVVDHEGVFAVLHPLLANGAAGVRGEELKRCRVARGRDHHHRVLHCPKVLEDLYRLGDRRVLLTNRDVDALHVLALLVENRIDDHGGLAGLAVTDY